MRIMDYNHIHFIGLKGSGMTALAILLKGQGKYVTGSDVRDVFYTDALLSDAAISCAYVFHSDNIPVDTQAVVYSAAYNEQNNKELRYALQHYPCFSYPQALGSFAEHYSSCAVIGTHGKTSTVALAGFFCKVLSFPIMALTGGRVADWGENTVWNGGDKGFIAEVCEYRNHMQFFMPNYAIFTSAELDHPDYFKDEDEVFNMFRKFLQKMERPQKIIACVDNVGVRTVIERGFQDMVVSYGADSPHCDVSIAYGETKDGKQYFQVKGLTAHADELEWSISIPGKSLILDAVAALILVREWASHNHIEVRESDWETVRDALSQFRGVGRRSEVLFRSDTHIVLDDYAHHPTAIKMILKGIKDFYQPKRLIVDFMSHTYTRTAALFDDFMQSFDCADIVIINNIYGSAREEEEYKKKVKEGNTIQVDGALFAKVLSERKEQVHFIADFDETATWVLDEMREGDLFLSLGAGDNFRIAQKVAETLRNK